MSSDPWASWDEFIDVKAEIDGWKSFVFGSFCSDYGAFSVFRAHDHGVEAKSRTS